jgi:uracil-DNA glycosylase
MTQGIDPKIEESWKAVLSEEFTKPYFKKLKEFLVKEKQQYTIFPPGNRILAAFDSTPFDKVKVVILGQDPYHGHGQAHGLCFSVPKGIQKPPSLVNIYKELLTDLNIPVAPHGNLEKWTKQGVLLLNATLTVRENQAGSHQKQGWETFTDAAIMKLSEQRSGIVFLLWGAYAQAKEQIIDTSKHIVLKAPHPSPLSASRGFLGCRHFSKTNEILVKNEQSAIDWNVG